MKVVVRDANGCRKTPRKYKCALTVLHYCASMHSPDYLGATLLAVFDSHLSVTDRI